MGRNLRIIRAAIGSTISFARLGREQCIRGWPRSAIDDPSIVAAAAARHFLEQEIAAANFGGITRDLMIGAVPPAAINDWRYVVVSLPLVIHGRCSLQIHFLECGHLWQ
jgi:hypothetical protein